jgi:hypothetical protein
MSKSVLSVCKGITSVQFFADKRTIVKLPFPRGAGEKLFKKVALGWRFLKLKLTKPYRIFYKLSYDIIFNHNLLILVAVLYFYFIFLSCVFFSKI